jgi:hypothetical protein
MALKNALANKGGKDNEPRFNPEVDAKITQFIKDNPKLYDYYAEQSKEQLIRKLMLGKMQRNEYVQSQHNEVREFLDQNPEIKEKVEERLRRMSPNRRERAFMTVARDEMMQHTMRQAREGAPKAGVSV